MQVSTTSYRGIEVVSIAGVIDSRATGPLCDTLVESVRAGDGMLIVDLSAVHLATRAGVRCFVVAAKLCESAGGAMRICGAHKPIGIVLRNLGFNHLIKQDRTMAESIGALVRDQVNAAAHELFPAFRDRSVADLFPISSAA